MLLLFAVLSITRLCASVFSSGSLAIFYQPDHSSSWLSVQPWSLHAFTSRGEPGPDWARYSVPAIFIVVLALSYFYRARIRITTGMYNFKHLLKPVLQCAIPVVFYNHYLSHCLRHALTDCVITFFMSDQKIKLVITLCHAGCTVTNHRFVAGKHKNTFTLS